MGGGVLAAQMAAVFAANVVQVITGFAGTLLAMPVSMLLIGLDGAKVSLNAVGFAASVWIALFQFKKIDWAVWRKICLWMAIGIVLAQPLAQLDIGILKRVYAVVVLAVAVQKLTVKKEIVLKKELEIPLLILAGVLHGLFVSGGSLLVIYALYALKEKQAFRATLSGVWVLLNGGMLVLHLAQGLYTPFALQATAVSLAALIPALWLGNVLFRKIPAVIFQRIAYALLLVSGISLLVL